MEPTRPSGLAAGPGVLRTEKHCLTRLLYWRCLLEVLPKVLQHDGPIVQGEKDTFRISVGPGVTFMSNLRERRMLPFHRFHLERLRRLVTSQPPF